MLPLELASRFGRGVPMGPADFDAKPMVLLLGQYSVGKTSFIRSLLGRDFPGIRIGPEPTTDRFLAVMRADDQDRVVPGNALAMRHDKPFAGLQGFGNAFLEKLQGAEVFGCPILDNVTLVERRGVVGSGRLGRDYDFPGGAVVRGNVDMIVVMFDAHKLDISDELKAAVRDSVLRMNLNLIRWRSTVVVIIDLTRLAWVAAMASSATSRRRDAVDAAGEVSFHAGRRAAAPRPEAGGAQQGGPGDASAVIEGLWSGSCGNWAESSRRR